MDCHGVLRQHCLSLPLCPSLLSAMLRPEILLLPSLSDHMSLERPALSDCDSVDDRWAAL